MILQPTKDRVVCKKDKPMEKTASGLLLGESKETHAYSIVESVGPEVKNIKKGDKVIIKEYTTTDIKIENTDYIIVKEDDIIAKLA